MRVGSKRTYVDKNNGIGKSIACRLMFKHKMGELSKVDLAEYVKHSTRLGSEHKRMFGDTHFTTTTQWSVCERRRMHTYLRTAPKDLFRPHLG